MTVPLVLCLVRRKNQKKRSKPTNAVASIASNEQTTTEHDMNELLIIPVL